LVPVALAIGTLHFLLSDQIVPRTTRALANWDANATDIMGASTNAAPASGSTGTPAATPAAAAPGVWVRDGNSLIHIRAVLAEGADRRTRTICGRGRTSTRERRTRARRAVYLAKHWTMADGEVLEPGAAQGRKPVNHAELPWQTSLTPNHLADLAADPATMSLAEVYRFAARPDVGSRPVEFYRTWMQRKIAVPLMTLLMVLLAAPVAQGLQRQGGFGMALAVGTVFGFLYFIAAGLLLPPGETGAIPPVVAAWSPMALFATFGIGALIRIEGY